MDAHDRESTDEQAWGRLAARFRDGDPEAVQEVWNRYGPLLIRIADQRMPPGLKRRLGAEDVVQSAYRSFFRRVQGGLLQLADAEGLWRLLCAITLTKVCEQARFHGRQKRDFDQEESMMAPSGDDSSAAWQPAAPMPTPAEEVEFADHFESLLESLDDEERQIVDLKLQECTHDEIAERMGSSERTVRRIFKRIQAKLGRALAVAPPAE